MVKSLPRCPECSGNMKYSRVERKYVCRSCGIALTMDEIWDARDKRRGERRDPRDDYLDWWLSRKK
jgi:tRNA(Ile2) C34 agmatinyltransferase TiaS